MGSLFAFVTNAGLSWGRFKFWCCNCTIKRGLGDCFTSPLGPTYASLQSQQGSVFPNLVTIVSNENAQLTSWIIELHKHHGTSYQEQLGRLPLALIYKSCAAACYADCTRNNLQIICRIHQIRNPKRPLLRVKSQKNDTIGSATLIAPEITLGIKPGMYGCLFNAHVGRYCLENLHYCIFWLRPWMLPWMRPWNMHYWFTGSPLYAPLWNKKQGRGP